MFHQVARCTRMLSRGEMIQGNGVVLERGLLCLQLTSCACGVSLCTDALVVGNGSYIPWPWMTLTLGYDRCN